MSFSHQSDLQLPHHPGPHYHAFSRQPSTLCNLSHLKRYKLTICKTYIVDHSNQSLTSGETIATRCQGRPSALPKNSFITSDPLLFELFLSLTNLSLRFLSRIIMLSPATSEWPVVKLRLIQDEHSYPPEQYGHETHEERGQLRRSPSDLLVLICGDIFAILSWSAILIYASLLWYSHGKREVDLSSRTFTAPLLMNFARPV